MKRPFRGLAAGGRGQPGLRQQCSPNDQALRDPPSVAPPWGSVGSRGVGAARTQPFLPGGPCTPCAPAATGSGTWDHRLPEARTDRESLGKCGAHAVVLGGSQATVWRTFSYQLSPSNQEWGQDPGSTDGAGDRDRLLGAVSGAAAPSRESDRGAPAGAWQQAEAEAKGHAPACHGGCGSAARTAASMVA